MPASLYHGRLQCARPVAWLTAQRVGLRAPLDGRVWSVKYQYRCLVCQKPTPLVSIDYMCRQVHRQLLRLGESLLTQLSIGRGPC
jgi:ribosomal protein S14